MPKVYAIDGITPVVHPSAFVHPSAVLIGDVIVRARAYIGPCASLRGDFGRIVVEEGANIQDTCMLHGFPGKDTVVGAESTIGHGAVLHGCVVRRGALVGMNCVVNDNAVVGEDAMVAALAFVKAEDSIPSRRARWRSGSRRGCFGRSRRRSCAGKRTTCTSTSSSPCAARARWSSWRR